MKNLSLYLHFPFCKSKCHYCDFYSIEKGNQYFSEYIDAIINEIKWQSKKIDNNYEVQTIYFGGGTPNLFSSNDLIKVLDKIRKNFIVKEDAEITIELNPEFCKDKTFFDNLKLAGFNRLSIGAQSMHNDELKFLGRIHNHETTVNAINLAKKSGFDNISLDMIFNIPQQKDENIVKTIEEFLSFDPKHISAYSLTKEKGTKYFEMVKSGKIKENADIQDRGHFKLCHSLLEKNNLSHYEISNYSIKGYKSKHNLNYWNGTDYIGFGPSAHSKIGNKRFWHNPSIVKYLNRSDRNDFSCDDSEILNDKQKFIELLMTQFRLKQGINKNKINFKKWVAIHETVSYINNKYSERYFLIDKNEIKCCLEGWVILDSLLIEIINILD
ncbi:MAG: radical SAM family heme chaperone HemW [Candidatus Marinimicrobia bacterium]|nr:radical SAM family heme chaperone HemW [Candidatus Neomarinimicrobiota bacterium]